VIKRTPELAAAPDPVTKPSELFSRTVHLAEGDAQKKREEIERCFCDTFDTYESLFTTLAVDDAYFQKSIPLRHPLMFYLGHTATFLVNKLVLAKILPERIDPAMESTFAVGVDEMSWDDLTEGHYAWPEVSAVMAYRQKVRAMVVDLIRTLPLQLPVGWKSPFWPILMGIDHERIHLETSSVLIRQHKLEYVQPQPKWAPNTQSGQAPQNELLSVAVGDVALGLPVDSEYYGWDNEYGRHEASVDTFDASKYLVSNQEFLEFVEAGGYSEDAYWSEEGLGWRAFVKASHPTFWVWHNQWFLRLMTEEVEMRWDWPAEVNYHEAKAFCEWKALDSGRPVRLPTEDEWHRLAEVAQVTEVGAEPAAANLHLDHGASSCPVTRFRHGQWFDVVGNVWQWTETPMYPFAGFEVHPLYDDFTTPTFDNRHNLIKGGSWISCGNEARLSARYAFRRHFFQHAGFRYVTSEAELKHPSAYYENDVILAQYSEFNFGENWHGEANFPKELAMAGIAALDERSATDQSGVSYGRALDIGCACGRTSFELATRFEHVDGIDFSANFIQKGVEMAEQKVIRYALPEEGDLVSYHERTLEEMGLTESAGRVTFHQGDACNLKSLFNNYDLIVAGNLIDRLYDPSQFLTRIHERLNDNGVLVIASPYTWLEEYTPRDKWVGGYKKDGENYSTLDGLKDMLAPHFRLMTTPRSLPFVIRETRNKYQHSLSELTVWEKVTP
jgi:5-histidylcysteine sulfoxide synthase/putative 4-mercaptohistidine N1-methyltranferase